ncbi:Na/Pi cotransporter family protein [Puniceibacterium sp. IMCC21224]|uniref:Na/Pi cotransporter family protein n=1 Tax=Puniceibacterium sp. IMCC21224 TaxID=1618204 RepID=UPI00064DCF90|nr:Na/Pi cotransporter family protein [Puniceibacterium sp. IMCC21224]KMK66698.1 Na+/phosphate symporter [Puniceibacterium sp. IMCC21224]
MLPLTFLLHLAGSVMLLLWAVRMVRTGVERAFGTSLKAALRGARDGKVKMAVAGMVLAIGLQSSTAVGILAAGFAASGILTVSAGIAALLGADLGSALVVKILSFDLSGLIPILLLVGGTLFLKFEKRSWRQVGRIALGIAFILLSLTMIGDATAPLRDSAALPQLVGYLRGDPLTAFGITALLAWLVHSSVATILMLVSFAAVGLLPSSVALPMVLGANVGGGIIAVWLSRSMDVAARRIPVGNLIFRGTAALLALSVNLVVDVPVHLFGTTEAAQLVNLHVAFNAVLVVVALPFAGPMTVLTERMLPRAPDSTDSMDQAGSVSVLDRSALDMPLVALASARREVLRMGDILSLMYHPLMDLMDGGNLEVVGALRRRDDQVNAIHTDIKLFVAEVNRRELSEREAKMGIELMDAAINLEHIGDIISKKLLPLVEERAVRKLQFSPEGWMEMNLLHARVEANMQLALNVLISSDIASARQLVREKESMRRLERDSHDKHLARLNAGNSESVETSDIHLTMVRGLKDINSLLVMIGYPILTESGQLLESRLAVPV